MAMTEIDFARAQCPDVRRFQLDTSSSDKAVQVNVPSFAKQVTIRPIGSKVRMAFFSDSDNIHSDYIDLSADTTSEFTMFAGHYQGVDMTKIYLANIATVTGTYVEVMIEAGDRPEQ